MIKLNNLLFLQRVDRRNLKKFATVYFFIFLNTLVFLIDSFNLINISSYTLTGFYLLIIISLAFKFLIESKNINSFYYPLAMFISAIIIFSSLTFYPDNTPFLLTAVCSFLFISPFVLKKENSNTKFLNFSLNLIYLSCFALFSTFILFLGLYGTFKTISYLFEFGISNRIYELITILIFCAILPIFIVSNLNRKLYADAFNKPLVFFVSNILIPILTIYISILYLYFLKIIFTFELPKGELSTLILAYTILGIFVYFLSLKVPTNKLVNLYKKFFIYTLFLPIVFLYLAIFIRVKEYGITEPRYAIILTAFWLTFSFFYLLKNKNEFQMKYIFLLITFLCLFASIGTFNASKLASKSQVERFKQILIANQLLKNNQATIPLKDLSYENKKELTLLSSYLNSNTLALQELEPYFKELMNKNNKKTLRYNILVLLQIEPTYSRLEDSIKSNNIAFSKEMVDISNYKKVIKLQLIEKQTEKVFYKNELETQIELSIRLEENKLIIKKKEKEIVFNILEYLNTLEYNETTNFGYIKAILEKEGIKIRIEYLNKNNSDKIKNCTFYLIL